jgi:hypothetical protein
MSKIMYAVIVAAALAAAPLPQVTPSATAQTTAPSVAKTKIKKPLSPGQIAARERQKKCGAEWKTAKAAGKIAKGMKWPQYWSACNKRLKSGA